jgi:putative addiction module component (TIGR02574 family)
VENLSSARAQKNRPENDWIKIMSPKVKNVMDNALQLPKGARALIAEKLLESLDFEEPFELNDKWKEEIARRCQEIDDGSVVLIPDEKVIEEAKARLQK